MRHAIGICGSFISSATRTVSSSFSSTSNQSYSRLLHHHAFPATPLPPNMVQLWMQLTSQLEENIKFHDERQQKVSNRAWDLNSALIRCEMAHETGDDSLSKEEETFDQLVRETVLSRDMYNNIIHDSIATAEDDAGEGERSNNKVHQRAPRLGSLGSKLEDYARYKSFHYFLSEEKLLPPNAPCLLITDGDTQRNILTDEEYLGGACIGLCHDLAKYGVTRASNAVDDPAALPFITKARDAVSMILEELLQFDFRNGPLRRKYDSTKYALKILETVLYELSVAGAVGGHKSLLVVGNEHDVDEGGPVKKMKIDEEDIKEDAAEEEDAVMQEKEADEESSGIPKKEICAIRERMDHRDKLRERLIKTSRDGQKAAKQSIFAMHRGDAKQASKLLDDCEKCVMNDLLPILEEEPTLRHGSFAGVLEEYVEGKLFYAWLHGDNENPGKGLNQASGKILLPDEIPLNISTEDYLGGLCDLTGEIGRFAVARGTVRDKESVQLCLHSNKSIYMTIKMLGKIPRGITKKVGTVSKSVEKLERALYEQSLMEMTGRKEFVTSVDEIKGVRNDDAED